MPQTEAKISTLRCEPYIANRPDCPEGYYGPPELILWRVFVDEVCVANRALPFLAWDDVIELGANSCVPIFGDGGPFVCTRLLEDKIFWFGVHSSFLHTQMTHYDETTLPINFIYVFDANQYQQAIEEAQLKQAENERRKVAETSPLQKLFHFLSGKPYTNLRIANPAPKPLPVLTAVELSDVLRNLYPRDLDLPLYRMPELESDRRGAELFRAVWNVINTQQAKVSEAPPNAIEVRMGLDAEVFVESVWQVGRIGDDIAILFEVEPHFPLWLGGFAAVGRWINLP